MDPDSRSSFASLLKEYRVTQGLSQEALAERAGLSREAINKLERGRRLSPRRDTVSLLARTLKLSPDERARLLAAAATQRRRAVAITRATSDPPSTLPLRLTSFIGREKEIAEVQALLRSKRLVTLTGAGGIGKTSLALEVAAGIQAQFADGVGLVELAALTDGEMVPPAIAAVLGVREQPGEPVLATLGTALGTTQRILVVDNCEHLALSCARVAEALLRVCPRLRILATSREPLRIGAEVVWRVPALTLPDGDPPVLAELSTSEAVRLFVERASAVRPGFALTPANTAAVAEICRRLDGIPLAIELAAARVNLLAVERIAERLGNALQLLTGGSRTALPRQQTVRATVDWSHNLLSEPERCLLRRLAVFAGGWTLEAAEAVGAGGAIDHRAVLDLLTQLLAKSLVQIEEHAGEERYRLLETLRQYGQDRLVEAGELAAMRNRHRDWFLNLVERAKPELIGREQVLWLDRLGQEHDNLRAALEWSLESDPEIGARLGACLWIFWRQRGYRDEGRRWLDRVLAKTTGATAARGWALAGAGLLAEDQGDYARAVPLLEESLGLFRAILDRSGIMLALRNLAGCQLEMNGDSQQVGTALDESLSLARSLGDERGISIALRYLGLVAALRHDTARCQALLEESLAQSRRAEDAWSTALTLGYLGSVALNQGNLAAARRYLKACERMIREQGDTSVLGLTLLELARLERAIGDCDRAAALLEDSLRLLRQPGDVGIHLALNRLGDLAIDRGEFDRGVRILAAAAHVRPGYGLWVLLFLTAKAVREASLAKARLALGDELYAVAWAHGQAMTLEDAVELALAERDHESLV